MTDDLPKRLLEDPDAPQTLKEDLRRSSEVPLPPELAEELERLAELDWEQLDRKRRRDATARR